MAVPRSCCGGVVIYYVFPVGFMDDVIFAHKLLRLLDVAARLR